MKLHRVIFAGLSGILIVSGCSHNAYHPWLGEEYLVGDDRMAGVWIGIGEDELEPDETDIFFVRPAADLSGEKDNQESGKVPAGYYAVSWIDNDSVESKATIEDAFIRPKNLLGGLYRIDSSLLVQLSGSTLPGHPLVAPLHVIYRAELEGDKLYLYDLKLDNMTEDGLLREGLLFEAEKDHPITFFSKTGELTAFIRKHLAEEGFFSTEPSLRLRRIRDLGGDMPDPGWEENTEEDLQPVR